MQRQTLRAVVLSALLVVALVAVAIPLGSQTATAQTSDSGASNFDATGNTTDTTDTWPQGFAEHNGSLYVGVAENPEIQVYDSDLNLVQNYSVSVAAVGTHSVQRELGHGERNGPVDLRVQ